MSNILGLPVGVVSGIVGGMEEEKLTVEEVLDTEVFFLQEADAGEAVFRRSLREWNRRFRGKLIVKTHREDDVAGSVYERKNRMARATRAELLSMDELARSEVLRKNLDMYITKASEVLRRLAELHFIHRKMSLYELTFMLDKLHLCPVSRRAYIGWLREILFALAFVLPREERWRCHEPAASLYLILFEDGRIKEFSGWERGKLVEFLLRHAYFREAGACQGNNWQSVGEGGRICGGSGLVIELRPA